MDIIKLYTLIKYPFCLIQLEKSLKYFLTRQITSALIYFWVQIKDEGLVEEEKEEVTLMQDDEEEKLGKQ